MKIDEIYQGANVIESAREKTTVNRETEQAATRGTPQEPEPGAEVKLSTTSVEVRLAREAMEARPPDRAEKVARIKEQISEGTYEADAKAVADKMLRTTISDLI